MKKETQKKILGIFIVVLVFWLSDFVFHHLGVGESNYYYLSKFANAILFSILWFFIFAKDSYIRRLIFSFIFGTWISFYYLVSSYSGVVQTFLGISARYTPPPFVIGALYLTPYIWWFFHSLVFYLGLELSRLVKKDSK